MKGSNNFLDIVAHYEGCKLKAYQDSGGVWTIGFGHTFGVKAGQVITLDQAKQFLSQDISSTEVLLNNLKLTLNQNQFDACLDFCYNEGIGNFERSSLCKQIKSNNLPVAIVEADFEAYDEAAHKVVGGLLSRRKTEALLFNAGELKFFN